MLSVEGEYERSEVVSRLVTAFQDLAAKDPQSLMLYIATLWDADVKFRACVMYLRQRFGARGSGACDPKTLSARTFVRDFIEVEVVPGRNNAVVPVVLTGLAQAWLVVAKPECFKVSADVWRAARFLGRLQERKEQVVESCKPSKHDEAEFELVIMAIGARVIVSSDGNAE